MDVSDPKPCNNPCNSDILIISFNSCIHLISSLYKKTTGVTRAPISTRSTSLNGIPEEKTAITLEKIEKAARWNEIRFLTDEEAEAQLEGDELESYKGYHSECKEGLNKLKGVAEMMLKSLDIPQIQPKGKKQRKRDKWALSQRVAAARAAEAKALSPNSSA